MRCTRPPSTSWCARAAAACRCCSGRWASATGRPRAPWQGGEGNDEGEMGLEVPDELIVRRDQVTPLSFGQGDVEAVVDAHAHLRGDLDGPGGQGSGGEKLGWGGHHVGPERQRL